ncbi:amidohydrolase [Pseudahrensia aquimaris]|uniref:Amidohydrolase n=1 Tax=Pseudahrensia aquimaris TaxID=744461 RepID=A0ABW3FGA8_9HYPH
MKTERHFAAMRDWRHDFHRHPELGFKEHRTSAEVARLLETFGLDVTTGIGGTGVIGVLQKGNATRSIGLRADMDALPITEKNVFDHRSASAGKMHACGHDGHTAMLLGAARHLAEDSDFSGRVVFIFQPAEEHGKGGPAMLADGVFDRFDVDDVYGMHNMPGLPVGSFALRQGVMMASEALFEINIEGQGGHAAMPHHGADALVIGAEIVMALQTIVSRKLDPGLNGVVSVTDFTTDGQRNILPGHARLTGDARALSVTANERIEEAMRQIVDGICAAHGVTGNVSYETVFEVLENSLVPFEKAVSAARTLVEADNVNSDAPPLLGSEDFAHFAKARPGCFILAGNGTHGPHAKPLHSADYDFNDDLLVPGSSFWVQLVEQELMADG